MAKIILIDDDPAVLTNLGERVREELSEGEAFIEEWNPSNDDQSAIDELPGRVGDDTILLVTDYDLSRSKALVYGDSIIKWCQRNTVPAALYSRGDIGSPTHIPDLFELKVPREERGRHIVELYRGFSMLARNINGIDAVENVRGLAGILARVLGEPNLEHEFAQYSMQLGEATGALTERVMRTAPDDADPERPSTQEIKRVLTYVLGHLLVNSVLRYPGPLLTLQALCAYIGTSPEEGQYLAEILAKTEYTGPFSGPGRTYWRYKVDEVIEGLPEPDGAISPYRFRRQSLERLIQRPLAPHGCDRCDGLNGGFYCPFTRRPVCERGDCSTGSNSWLPLGATVCRIELSFFEEWAPLLRL